MSVPIYWRKKKKVLKLVSFTRVSRAPSHEGITAGSLAQVTQDTPSEGPMLFSHKGGATTATNSPQYRVCTTARTRKGEGLCKLKRLADLEGWVGLEWVETGSSPSEEETA